MTDLPTIDTGSGSAQPPRRSRKQNRFVSFYVLGCLVVIVLVVLDAVFFPPVIPDADRKPSARVSSIQTKAVAVDEADSAEPTPPSNMITDDGRTIWASPTAGPPIDLAYLPPGVQIILALRPAALIGQPEGEKVLAALGPLGRKGIDFVEQATGRPFGDLERLVVGWQTDEKGDWEVAIVARIRGEEINGNVSASSPPFAFPLPPLIRYEPPGHDGRVLVVAPPAAIEEIKTLAGRRPPLRRDIQRLVDGSDATRDVTLLVAPSFLFGDGHTLFTGESARLREPLFWFLGDGLAAVSLSMNWDANFFVELRAVPTLDALPDEVAEQFLDRVRELPDRVEEYVISMTPHPYGRRIVARFPAMIRKLVTYSRMTYDGREAILRCYLPAVAGHNLLMGAELTLAQPPSGSTPTAGPLESLGNRRGVRPGDAGSPDSVAERLERRTSLRFPRDTLEAALDMLAQDVGVEIILSGRDLQLEGITKNQSFGLDLQELPAGEILVQILRQANPDKSADGPADERQKLVYVIKPREPGGPEAVFITTRAQARQRGDRLPDVFIPQKP